MGIIIIIFENMPENNPNEENTLLDTDTDE